MPSLTLSGPLPTLPGGEEPIETPEYYTRVPTENVQEGLPYQGQLAMPTSLQSQGPITPLTTPNEASGCQGQYLPPRGQDPSSMFQGNQPGWNVPPEFQNQYIGQSGQAGQSRVAPGQTEYLEYPTQQPNLTTSAGFQPQYASSAGQKPAYRYSNECGATSEQMGPSGFQRHDVIQSGQTAQSEFQDLYRTPERQESPSGFSSASVPQNPYQVSTSPVRPNMFPASGAARQQSAYRVDSEIPPSNYVTAPGASSTGLSFPLSPLYGQHSPRTVRHDLSPSSAGYFIGQPPASAPHGEHHHYYNPSTPPSKSLPPFDEDPADQPSSLGPIYVPDPSNCKCEPRSGKKDSLCGVIIWPKPSEPKDGKIIKPKESKTKGTKGSRRTGVSSKSDQANAQVRLPEVQEIKFQNHIDELYMSRGPAVTTVGRW